MKRVSVHKYNRVQYSEDNIKCHVRKPNKYATVGHGIENEESAPQEMKCRIIKIHA